jgi:SSS family solute:Na+ symporter
MQLLPIDYAIMLVYLVFVLGIGFALKRMMKSSEDFFLSGRSIPAWITGLAFISANLGAQEVIGMGASGAKYGIATSHFYWIGAIPAMVFVGIFMMPFYYGSRARSVPEYLKLRFDEKTRGFNAISFAVMTVFSSGVSMYAMGMLFNLLLGWDFDKSVWISAAIVLCYISLGGLTSAIYNEVLQFFLIVFGFLPLTLLGLKSIGGWNGLIEKMQAVAVEQGYSATAYTRSWAHMGDAATNPMGIEWFGLAMGLGFVLSFGYWCTDFLVVQRAMAADSMSSARRTPLIAALPKMVFPFLVIIPGMIALVATSNMHDKATGKILNAPAEIVQGLEAGKGIIPAKLIDVKDPVTGEKIIDPATQKPVKEVEMKDGKAVLDYNKATPMMLLNYFPSGMLGLGLAALLASFMSGMAGNVTAFNTVWTYDIYHSYVNPKASDQHLLWMGRFTTVWGIALSVAAAYVAKSFDNIMDVLQLVFSYVNAPLLATFLLGMFWRRSTGHGAFSGLVSGTLAASFHQAVTTPKGAWLVNLLSMKPAHVYTSEMAQNFWGAIWAFSTCFIVTFVVSLVTKPRPADELRGLVYSLTPKPEDTEVVWWKRPAALAVIVMLLVVLLNGVFY